MEGRGPEEPAVEARKLPSHTLGQGVGARWARGNSLCQPSCSPNGAMPLPWARGCELLAWAGARRTWERTRRPPLRPLGKAYNMFARNVIAV